MSDVRPFNRGGGSAITPTGGDGGMEARIAKLESDVAHIDRAITEIKSDVRDIRNGGIGAVVLLLGALAGGFLYLANRDDAVNEKVTQILVGIEQLANKP